MAWNRKIDRAGMLESGREQSERREFGGDGARGDGLLASLRLLLIFFPFLLFLRHHLFWLLFSASCLEALPKPIYGTRGGQAFDCLDRGGDIPPGIGPG